MRRASRDPDPERSLDAVFGISGWATAYLGRRVRRELRTDT
jgi:hypothetical protein